MRIAWRVRLLALTGVFALSACNAPLPLENAGSLNTPRPPAAPALQSSLIAPGASTPPAKPALIRPGTGQFVANGNGDGVVAAKTAKGADGVTINLLNAPIAQAAKSILDRKSVV